MRRAAGAVFVAAISLIAATSASAKTHWLCTPGMKHDPCTPSFKTTQFSSWDTKIRTYTPKKANPKVDCFYVYPTVSNEQGPVADLKASPEIKSIALYQAARFSNVCRVYAPLYRQITVPGLNSGKVTAAQNAVGDKDLAAAWKDYLAHYNKGRGVVLIGHSQGSFRLTTLIQRQIDEKAAVRRKLVSAILLGGNETVKIGSDRGGSFQNVPVCKSNTQTGCLIAYSSFNQTPPNNPLFGKAATPDQEVVCTNPASLAGGPKRLDSIEPTTPYASGLIAAGIQLLHLTLPKVSTPFIEATDAFSGQCVTENNSHFLKITSLPGTPVPDPSPTPEWGLHLLDMNVAQGDLVKLVATQARAWGSKR